MRLVVVPIGRTSASGALEAGVPRPLFQTRIATSGPYVFTAGVLAKAQYAVAANGRFLMNIAENVIAPPITLVVNWAAGLAE